MTKRLVPFFLVWFGLVPLSAQDMSTMNAVELNTAGFRLYEAGKFEQSLTYFKASFEKDPEYSYPHYNYACVLSILKKGKDEITEHLLKAFFLDPQFREKYWSDPDLDWFRKDPETGNPQSEYFQFLWYKTDINAELTRNFLLKGESVITYDIIDPTAGVGVFPYGNYNFLGFTSTGTVQLWGGDPQVNGVYQITGNLVYIELDESIEMSFENDSFPMKRIVVMCDSDERNIRRGFVLLVDSLRPIEMLRHIETGGV